MAVSLRAFQVIIFDGRLLSQLCVDLPSFHVQHHCRLVAFLRSDVGLDLVSIAIFLGAVVAVEWVRFGRLPVSSSLTRFTAHSERLSCPE